MSCQPLSREALVRYTQIPISFMVEEVLEPVGHELADWRANAVDPILKDYDELESPLSWLRWDVRNWCMQMGHNASAVVAWDTPGIDMLEGRSDLAVLWDIRVPPATVGEGGEGGCSWPWRTRQGVGAAPS